MRQYLRTNLVMEKSTLYTSILSLTYVFARTSKTWVLGIVLIKNLSMNMSLVLIKDTSISRAIQQQMCADTHYLHIAEVSHAWYDTLMSNQKYTKMRAGLIWIAAIGHCLSLGGKCMTNHSKVFTRQNSDRM